MGEVNLQGEKSAFNMGAATLKRIDKILQEMEYYSITNQFVLWAKKLINLHKELRPFTVKNEKTRKEMDRVMKEILIFEGQYNFNPMMMNVKKVHTDLMAAELYLRDVLIEYDLLMPKKDDPRYAVLQR